MLLGLGAGVLLIALFLWHAVRAAGHALIDLRLFRDRAFAGAAGTVFIFGVSLFGAMLILPLYYQVARSESALSAGLLLAPQGVGAAMAMPIAGRLTDKYGAGRIVPFGVVVAVLGTAVFTQLSGTTGYGVLGVALWVRGIGLGMTMMPAMAAAYSTLERGQVPRATTVLNIIRTIGGSVGTAVLTVVLQRQIVANVPGATGELDALGGAGLGARGRAARPRVRADVLVGGRADRPGADPGVLSPAPAAGGSEQRDEPAPVAIDRVQPRRHVRPRLLRRCRVTTLAHIEVGI